MNTPLQLVEDLKLRANHVQTVHVCTATVISGLSVACLSFFFGGCPRLFVVLLFSVIRTKLP